jgi:hypothetical protein
MGGSPGDAMPVCLPDLDSELESTRSDDIRTNRAAGFDGINCRERLSGSSSTAGTYGTPTLYDDFEIFSDDGSFGSAHPNSIRALPSNESLGRAREASEQSWSAMPPSAASRRQTVKEWK